MELIPLIINMRIKLVFERKLICIALQHHGYWVNQVTASIPSFLSDFCHGQSLCCYNAILLL